MDLSIDLAAVLAAGGRAVSQLNAELVLLGSAMRIVDCRASNIFVMEDSLGRHTPYRMLLSETAVDLIAFIDEGGEVIYKHDWAKTLSAGQVNSFAPLCVAPFGEWHYNPDVSCPEELGSDMSDSDASLP